MTPPKGSPAGTGDTALALEIIGMLLAEEIDILCLGEVAPPDLVLIREFLEGTPLRVEDLTNSDKANKFNMCAVYRADLIDIADYEFIIGGFQFKNYKTAVRLTCVTRTGLHLEMFVVHWASRLLSPDGLSARDNFGKSLRENIESRSDLKSDFVIALGDFNDEPYNSSISATLGASRDSAFVAQRRHLLYNPFWKSMTCSKGYLVPSEVPDQTGTYYYARDAVHRWRVFDQMLFSSSFVSNGVWNLNESKTGVWRDSRLVEAVVSRKSKMDHLPIIGEVRSLQQNG